MRQPRSVRYYRSISWLFFHRKLLILFSAAGSGALDSRSILATTDKLLEVQPNIPQLSLHCTDDGLVFCSHVVRSEMTHARLPPSFPPFLHPPPPHLLSKPSLIKYFPQTYETLSEKGLFCDFNFCFVCAETNLSPLVWYLSGS